VWGAEEVGAALDLLEGQQLYPLWLCMAGCGLSRSEALALDWEDIEFAETLGMDGKAGHTAIITVGGAVTAYDGQKGPKNSRRYRRVIMQPLFANRLFAARGEGPICQSRRYTNDGGRPTGRRLSPGYVPKAWKKYFEEGGCLESLPFVEIGRMRASYATLMQQAGIDSTVINAMQGRSSNSQVLYTNYLSPQLATYATASERMARLVETA
jgi:integrase